jgi:hypothetical protein
MRHRSSVRHRWVGVGTSSDVGLQMYWQQQHQQGEGQTRRGKAASVYERAGGGFMMQTQGMQASRGQDKL